MPDYITDPELLKTLGNPDYVTDPNILRALNGENAEPKTNQRGFIQALRDREQQDAVDRMRANRTQEEKDMHAASLTGRITLEGLTSGVLGLPALVGDSFAGVARDMAYGGKKLLSKTGAVEPPDPANYYDESKGRFPLVSKAVEAGEYLPNKLNLDRPETRGERIVAGGGAGAFSALSGAGLAALAARVPGAVGRIAAPMAERPVMQALSGATGGAAGQSAAELGANEYGVLAASVLGSAVPAVLARSGRVTVSTPEGQRATAGEIIRGRLTDQDEALRNLDTVEGRTRIAGFRHLSSDAARDPGLAAVAPRLRNMANEDAGGAVTRIKEGNSSILSRALDMQGARPGTAEQSRQVQRAQDAARIQAMDLDSLPPADVTALARDMEAGTNIRQTGAREAVGRAHGEMLGRLQQGATPIVNDANEIVGHEMPMRNMLSMRQDFSEARKPGSVSSPNPSSLKNARRETRGFMDRIDEELNTATLGDYNDYLTASRRGRAIADSQEYMEDFANSVHKGGQFNPDGSRVIDEGAWLARVNTKADRPLPSGNRSMNLDKVEGTRPQFLRDAAADINDAQYANRVPSYGPNTASKLSFDEEIRNTVAANRSPYARMTDPILTAIGYGSNALAKTVAPFAGSAARGVSGFGADILSRRAGTAEGSVRRILGMAEADPAMMAELIRTSRAYNPGFRDTLAVRAGNVARVMPQNFLAVERSERYR